MCLINRKNNENEKAIQNSRLDSILRNNQKSRSYHEYHVWEPFLEIYFGLVLFFYNSSLDFLTSLFSSVLITCFYSTLPTSVTC